MATGFQIMEPAGKDLLGLGVLPDVITGPQMDRLLSPTRPYNGVLRPSDGKEPESIAMVLCSGSRDHTFCNPLCCRIGCMYAIKQAQLLMGALPIADVTIYYIDIRAFGKGYEEFYEQAKGMGVNFVKGKVGGIEQLGNGKMALRFDDMLGTGGAQTREHDLVVLAVGLLPNTAPFALLQGRRAGKGCLQLRPRGGPNHGARRHECRRTLPCRHSQRSKRYSGYCVALRRGRNPGLRVP